MTPGRYRKRPIVVEAMQWLGPPRQHDQIPGGPPDAPSVDDLLEWGAKVEPPTPLMVWVAPEKVWMPVPPGFWIIKGVIGEFYPCDPEVFERTYERVG